MDFEFWILGFGFWVLGFGFWVLGFGFWILDFGVWGTLQPPRGELGGPLRPLHACGESFLKGVPGPPRPVAGLTKYCEFQKR